MNGYLQDNMIPTISKYKTLKLIDKGSYVIVELDNGKVNSINNKLSKELLDVFQIYEADDQVKGLILSGRPHCFSAGLDVVNLATASLDHIKDFWRYYLGAIQTMIRFSKPYVCAMTGYSPAGATIIALTADYRVMGRGAKHKIGMHEFRMSMQIPELLCDVYAYHLGEKRAWEAVQNAKLFSSDEALNLGLVNESVEVEEVLERAEKQLKKLMNVYAPVFSESKKYLRKELLSKIDRNIEEMVTVIEQQWDNPFVKQSMEMFLASLKKKK